jgi:ElaB/YqjD/DUF883 family membrane-anchored ribosome-binding protein
VSPDDGKRHETSTHGAGIERPDDGEQVDDRVTDHTKFTESKVRNMADPVRQTLSGAADAAQRTVQEAPGHIRSAVDQARGKMTEYRKHGWGRVQDDIVEYTRSQPLAALGVAAAIGLLLGWLSSTARRGGAGLDSRLDPVPELRATDQRVDSTSGSG